MQQKELKIKLIKKQTRMQKNNYLHVKQKLYDDTEI